MYHYLSINTKLAKVYSSYLVTGLSMAPHGLGGHQVCPEATPGCMAACVLWFTGRTVTQSVRAAMVRRKTEFCADPKRCELLLRQDIEKHAERAEAQSAIPAIRLNVASDLDWSHIARDYPAVTFYDYTKVRSRLQVSSWPANYELTYSHNERTHWRTSRAQLERGGNVAAVFSTRYHPQSGRIDTLPESYRIGGRLFPVVDGDKHDVRLRSADGHGVIVGLRFKGSLAKRSKAIQNGFCLDVTS